MAETAVLQPTKHQGMGIFTVLLCAVGSEVDC